MGIAPTLLLGLIAGSTILIGLPVGRLRNLSPTVRHLLNAIAVGVLLFLFWDVLVEAWEPIDDALAGIHESTGGFGPAFGYGALFAGGLAIGLLSMVAYESYLHRMSRPSGRGADVWDELHPTAQQQRDLYDWLVARGEQVLTGDSF